LIIGDIDEYYFCDFENNSLLVTCIRYKADKNGNFVTLDGDDLSDEEHLPGILRGLFNSGSYMINVDKQRRDGSSVNDFIVFKNEIAKVFPEKQDLYFGDQGLLAAAFAGDIKYFGYPETKNLWYQPYNFCIWFFDRAAEICGGNPWYTPRILHFAGGIKPWNFSKENEKDIKPGQWPFYKIYMLYANQVPLVTI
jgi:lipopolysaccharide biosynthesis glycosyltransferase